MNSSDKVDPSVQEMWERYLAQSGEPSATPSPMAWHFCDNQVDADTCAALALAGRKHATASSLWFFQSQHLRLPSVGDLEVVTSWNGIAQCIIRTTAVQIVPFSDVTNEHASAEGEGDGSLGFWRARPTGSTTSASLRGPDTSPQKTCPWFASISRWCIPRQLESVDRWSHGVDAIESASSEGTIGATIELKCLFKAPATK